MCFRRPARTIAIVTLEVTIALALGCETADSQLTRAAVVGRFARPEIRESSGVVRSIDQPGVFWTMNDSGGDPVLFAFDSTGRDLGAFRVVGARNQDWESLAIGPCQGTTPAATCLFVGETGDNNERRKTRRIYRVPEPRVLGRAGAIDTTATATMLVFTYADRPHDVEGMYVSADGAVHLITKGRSGGILHYRLAPDAWRENGRAVAERADSLPIIPDLRARRSITDAAIAPGGRHVAVRTYHAVYVFRSHPATGAIETAVAPTECDVRGLRERGGEGVTWVDASGILLLTSEGKAGQISLAQCPLP